MKVVVAGSLAQRPSVGGHAWVFLQYLLGLQRLGCEVMFLDRLEPVHRAGGDAGRQAVDQSVNVRHVVETMAMYGLDDCYAVLGDEGIDGLGMSRREILQHATDALLLNVMGFVDDEDVLAAARLRVFVDIDPGFGQMWRELGLADVFGVHDRFVTIGESVGQPGCGVPTCGIDWIPTRPPIVLEHWPYEPAPHEAPVTGVASWRGPFGAVDFGGRTYGLRVHEFRKFIDLPRRTGQHFELALDIHEAEATDLAALDESGWALVDPRRAVGDPKSYQGFIQRSRAELMIAKNMYVDTVGGWFSDRSVCYLASGRPVIAQDTGWTEHVPAGKGLLSFSTLDEAIAAVEDLNGSYEAHCQAARLVAEEHFDSDRVLPKLLADVGVG